MISNDIAKLFEGDPSDPKPMSLRQGVLQAWDSSTGDNEVLVGGGLLVNVPVLTSESTSLTVGDVVSLLTTEDRVLLIGKVTTPGDPGTVPSWSADLIALDTTVTTLSTVTVPAVQAQATAAQADATQAAIDAAAADAAAAQAVIDAAAAAAAAAAADAAAAQAQADAILAQAAADAAQAAADLAAAQTAALQADLDITEAAVATLTDTTLPALQSELDGAEADVAAAQADITTLTGTTIPGLTADIAAAQADVDAILPIGTTDISDDAITTPKIAAGQITAVKIAANTITAAEIAANAITASELAANAVTAGKIAAGTIVAADIASDTITASQIAAGAITATELATDSVIAAKIQAGAITSTKIAADAIDGKTITGALIRTAASGARIVLNDPAFPNETVYYTNNADETAPGRVRPVGAGGAALQLRGPDVTTVASPATLDLNANNATGETSIEMDADLIRLAGSDARITAVASLRLGDGSDYITFAGHTIDAETGPLALVGTAAATSNGVPIVTTTDTQTVTNKNLTSGTNTFPTSLATLTGTQTLTNKDLSSGTNTLPTSVVTLTGTQTLTNKNLTSGNTFPTSLATLTGTQTLTNKDLSDSSNTFVGKMLTNVQTAACTATSAALTTTEIDVTGCSITLTTLRANARYVVDGSFYFGANTGGTGVASGKLNIDGTNQTPFANFTGATTLDRANVAQTWTGTLASAGSHTLKLRAVTTTGGDFRFNATHTTITVQIFE